MIDFKITATEFVHLGIELLVSFNKREKLLKWALLTLRCKEQKTPRSNECACWNQNNLGT